MANKDIMADGKKSDPITVYPKGVGGSPELFEDVQSWRLGYNGILIIELPGETEIFAPEVWNRINIVA